MFVSPKTIEVVKNKSEKEQNVVYEILVPCMVDKQKYKNKDTFYGRNK